MFRHCFVPNCDSERQDVKLHKLPVNEDRSRLWIKMISTRVPSASTELKDLTWEEIRKSHVCHKHFENKYVRPNLKLTINACPTLFTEREMQRGTPKKIYAEIESMERARCMSNDHSKKHHRDHSYARDTVLPDLANIIDPETSTNIPQLNALSSQNDEKDLLDVAKSSLDEIIDNNFGKHVVKSKASRDSCESNPYVEGIPEFYNDVEESFEDFQESQQEPLFSWEKNLEVVSADDSDSVACLGQQEAIDHLPAEISLYFDDDSCSGKPDSDEKVPETESHDYKCNLCQELILGFRYTCVQCADFDLCAACEARGAHDAHYVLRVPGQRPYSEIQAVLHALRQQILSENLFLDPIDGRLKEEIKIELDEALVDPDKDPVPGVGLPPDIDPLPVPDLVTEQRPESQNTCESSEESDADSPNRYGTRDEIFAPSDDSQLHTISSDESDASRSPRRKRTRITSPKTYKQHNQRLPMYYIPQKQKSAPSTTYHHPIIHTPKMPTRFYQRVNTQDHQTENAREQTVIVIQENQEEVSTRESIILKEPIVCLNRILDQENFIVIQENQEEVRPTESIVLKEPIVCLNRILDQENLIVIQENQEEVRPTESIAQREPIVSLPRIDMRLQKQGNPGERVLRSSPLQPPSSKDHAMLIMDQSQQIVIGSDDNEPMEILPDNLKKQNEQPEFILKLPPNTNEEALIQALQSLVTVRLKRDF